MALILNKENSARLLREGLRRYAAAQHVSVLKAEEDLSRELRIEHRRLVSWTRPSSIPSEIADDLLLGLVWLILRWGNTGLSWLVELLTTTSIIVVEPPSMDWFRACFKHVRFDGKYIPTAAVQQLAIDVFAASEDRSAAIFREARPGYGSDPRVLLEPMPHVVSVPILHVHQFFGREAELKRIFDAIGRSPLQNAAIIGTRASGKTSLLHHVQHIALSEPEGRRLQQRGDWLPNASNYRWIRVNFRDPRMLSAHRLLKHLLVSLDLPVSEPIDLGSFMDVFSAEYDSRRPTVILMDEVDAGLASPELDMPFWWTLRSLCSHASNGSLGFIITSSAPPIELARNYGKPSPFFNIFGHTIVLGPLETKAARELIRSADASIPEDDLEWILDQSHRWPAALQLLGDMRLSAKQEDNPNWRIDALSQLQHMMSGLEPAAATKAAHEPDPGYD